MKRHPVVWFYVLAFALTWLGWLPLIMGSYGFTGFLFPVLRASLLLAALGPTLAALVVVWAVHGKEHLAPWFRSLWRWRAGATWWAVAVILPALLLLLGKAFTFTLKLPLSGEEARSADVGLLIPLLVVALLSNPWEEVGWRGFALPRLQKQYSALISTLIVGVLWVLWHLPLFFWPENPMSQYSFPVWSISLIATAFTYTWLYNSSGGSVAVVSLYHVLLNTYQAVITGVSLVAILMANVVVAGMLIIAFGAEHLARRERIVAE